MSAHRLSQRQPGESVRDRFLGWLLADRPVAKLLPGRPPHTARPPGSPDGSPGREISAVCCSGGGIRAAAFALGGIQGLSGRRADGRSSWFDELDLITAVSGGSYLAGSYALVNHSLQRRGGDVLPAYAPGSPEDNRLRAHTRYLIEDPKVAAVGVLNIVYGLLINLLPLLAGLFVVATLLGWQLRDQGLLQWRQDDPRWVLGDLGQALTVSAVIAAAGLALFSLERLLDVYRPPNGRRSAVVRTWSLRLLALAVITLVLFVAVPALVQALAAGTALGDVPLGVPPQLAGLGATTIAIVGAVKTTLGRFRGKLQTSSPPGRTALVPDLVGKAVRAMAPWAGSGLCLLLLAAAFLSWVGTAAWRGPGAGQLVLVALALLGIFVWQLAFDVNRNSIHPFYRERLSSAFFAARRDASGSDLELLDYSVALPLSGLANDRPALVICAAVNTDEEGIVPSGRGCAPFTFSARWCGISSGAMFQGEDSDSLIAPATMQPTTNYERIAGPRLVTLPGAVAVSGAAVSPIMGRVTRAPMRLLLGLANVRLGLWLPNPKLANAPEAPSRDSGVLARMRWQLGQPGMRALLAEMLGHTRLDGRWVYVTDGGHYENLGLVEALRRGARQIVVFDASGDPPNSWLAFGEAVQTARADLGVEIVLDPSAMRPPAGELGAPTLVVRGTCTFPDGTTGELYLCKLAMPAKASWDVHAWARRNPRFPNDSTLQQLYGDREFEAYRRLGEIAAEHARLLLEDRAVDLTRAEGNGSGAAGSRASGDREASGAREASGDRESRSTP